MSKKQTPSDFLKQIINRPVVVKLNSGVDYRGVLACLDGYMNIALEQTEEYLNGQLKNKMAALKRHYDVKFDLDGTEYMQLEKIGTGAYGVVCSAINKRTNRKVAIKKIPNVLDHIITAKRTYREIRILRHFRHDNIISIRDILIPNSSSRTGPNSLDIYVVLDLMESDLHRIIQSHQELSIEHVRFFLYQVLRGLKYIHSGCVIHRDLKPSNLLVNADCELKIGDFGMARGISLDAFPGGEADNSDAGQRAFMTQYVSTRWYRAPELMFPMSEYGASIDLWSVGVIFAEMLGRKQLFPGKNYLHQLQLIISVLGSPPEELLDRSEIFRSFIPSLGTCPPKSWSSLYPRAPRTALHLLDRLLLYDSRKRLTAEQALQHPFLAKYHDEDDEPRCTRPFNFDFEKEELTSDDLRKAMLAEYREFRQPAVINLGPLGILRPASVPANVTGAAGDSRGQSSLQPTVGQASSTASQAKSDQQPPTERSSTDHISHDKQLLDDNFRPQQAENTTVSPVNTAPKQSSAVATAVCDVQMAEAVPAASHEDCAESGPLESMLSRESTSTVGDEVFDAHMAVDEAAQPSGSVAVGPDSVTQPQEESKAMDAVLADNEAPMDQTSGKSISTAPADTTCSLTVSEDTKAKVRAALQVAAARRQAMACENARNEERKQKQGDRKRRSQQDGQSEQSQLSDEDKGLLARWTAMQADNSGGTRPNIPPGTGPEQGKSASTADRTDHNQNLREPGAHQNVPILPKSQTFRPPDNVLNHFAYYQLVNNLAPTMGTVFAPESVAIAPSYGAGLVQANAALLGSQWGTAAVAQRQLLPGQPLAQQRATRNLQPLLPKAPAPPENIGSQKQQTGPCVVVQPCENMTQQPLAACHAPGSQFASGALGAPNLVPGHAQLMSNQQPPFPAGIPLDASLLHTGMPRMPYNTNKEAHIPQMYPSTPEPSSSDVPGAQDLPATHSTSPTSGLNAGNTAIADANVTCPPSEGARVADSVSFLEALYASGEDHQQSVSGQSQSGGDIQNPISSSAGEDSEYNALLQRGLDSGLSIEEISTILARSPRFQQSCQQNSDDQPQSLVTLLQNENVRELHWSAPPSSSSSVSMEVPPNSPASAHALLDSSTNSSAPDLGQQTLPPSTLDFSHIHSSAVGQKLTPNAPVLLTVQTPPGSGVGYGVGIDIEDLLKRGLVNLPSNGRGDNTPGSTGVLYDWLRSDVDSREGVHTLERALQLNKVQSSAQE